MVVQNQLEKVVKLFALPRSRMGNISAHTTQTTGIFKTREKKTKVVDKWAS